MIEDKIGFWVLAVSAIWFFAIWVHNHWPGHKG
ncbi:hypothetical protein KDJ07_gp61 [Arthrobacter phage Urla]|uniref:Uncharacterized protein n=1 Tax=Arthrobacter phage Urla TaxID=2047867 RepID=A0A2H4P969_9CAUD|nr:hypothetical protein KDJ07_gp61 [Arthrobacter phage Urla]ATW58775.1 hypothetical protein PHIRE_URLA_61 [Arthrobacter phage Urla]